MHARTVILCRALTDGPGYIYYSDKQVSLSALIFSLYNKTISHQDPASIRNKNLKKAIYIRFQNIWDCYCIRKLSYHVSIDKIGR